MTGTDRRADHASAPGPDGAVRATFDWSSTAPSTGVIETVASASGRDPLAFEPLYGVVDPDALDALVRSTEARSVEEEATVAFAFAGHEVEVHSAGIVVVEPAESRPDPS